MLIYTQINNFNLNFGRCVLFIYKITQINIIYKVEKKIDMDSLI